MCNGYESSFCCEFLYCHIPKFLLHIFYNALFNIAKYILILNYYKILWVKQWMKNDRNSWVLNSFSSEGEHAHTSMSVLVNAGASSLLCHIPFAFQLSQESTEYIPTRITKVAAPKPAANPLQFIKVGPASLYKSAQEQLKKVEEIKKVTKEVRDEAEDWQSVSGSDAVISKNTQLS
jgi:F-box protein 20